ncbi:MAG: hypothetical protein C0594_14665 [Marinilabiliales bacterium]|nr:MAG: hypothetical protein C0594_14665 [Marinilabiliales bacterium]
MYLRYFMWNFVGRQNDIQGHGEFTHGNWLSGIKFIDEARLGSQENLPAYLKNNKARNKYYFLPFLLGIFGLFTQYRRSKRDFTVVTLLFVFTGIAIVVYLNQYPYQPRERDYAYAGSFYAFAIWIGLGLIPLYNLLKKALPGTVGAGIATVAALLLVPGIMAKENWDDHDRSNRYMARDFAKNYLNSCAPNSILVTYGDNDTFPLWYVQEVEGVRTDVRVLCFTLFNTDWYIDQMARKAYESDAMKFSMDHSQYVQGKRDIVYALDDERIKEPVELSQAMEFVASDDKRTKLPMATDEDLDYIPTKKLRLYVDSAKVVQNGIVKPEDADKIVPYIDFNVKGNWLQKNELMLLDFLAQNNWDRPVYFTSMGDMSVSFRDYLQLDGFAYRFVPIKTKTSAIELGRIDSDVLYDHMMNKFVWGNLDMPGIYLDQTIVRTTNIVRIRSSFDRLAAKLIREGEKEKALKVLDKGIAVMPNENIPYDLNNIGMIESYYKLGEDEKANEVARVMFDQAKEELQYYFSLPTNLIGSVDYEMRVAMRVIQELMRVTKEQKQTEFNTEIEESFNDLYMQFVQIMEAK